MRYREELQAAFKDFDVDGNGFISSMELSTIMTNLGESLSTEDIDFMIGLIDDVTLNSFMINLQCWMQKITH